MLQLVCILSSYLLSFFINRPTASVFSYYFWCIYRMFSALPLCVLLNWCLFYIPTSFFHPSPRLMCFHNFCCGCFDILSIVRPAFLVSSSWSSWNSLLLWFLAFLCSGNSTLYHCTLNVPFFPSNCQLFCILLDFQIVPKRHTVTSPQSPVWT